MSKNFFHKMYREIEISNDKNKIYREITEKKRKKNDLKCFEFLLYASVSDDYSFRYLILFFINLQT